MKLLQKFLLFFLVVVLCGTLSFSALAAPVLATPAELSPVEFPLATSSDSILFDSVDFELSSGVSLLEAPTVTNTVNYNFMSVQLVYYDMSNNVRFATTGVDSSGNWSLKRPNDYVKPYYISVVLAPKALPPVGKYDVGVALRFNAGVDFNQSIKPVVFTSKEIDNAGSLSSSFYILDYVMDLDAYSHFSLNLATNVENLVQTFYLNSLSFNSSGYANGWAAVQFTRLSSSANTDGSVAGSDEISSDDIQQNINNSVGNISSGVSEISDRIAELIQTIIYQLEALWNQFAGVFTSMFSAWEVHTQQIVQAIQDIATAAQEGIENIIDAGHEDTETITDGYDNSHISSDNDRLSGSLDEYDAAEDDLMQDVNDAINDVDFSIDLTSFSAVISTISGFLQECYENSGNFKIVINLSLLVSLASCVIGLYRFKGGA